MKKTLETIKLFGIYSMITGIVLLVYPHVVLPISGIAEPVNAWMRMPGFVLMCSSYYYIRSAFSGNIEFAKWTIPARFAAPVVVTILIVAGLASKTFLPFGIADGLGGLMDFYCFTK
ncbi:MAG: hypothetical protein K2X48_18755 [Chitinophagaceae bacterium]|nr:hypothetical protein [Chitinophagaceae bacterium]